MSRRNRTPCNPLKLLGTIRDTQGVQLSRFVPPLIRALYQNINEMTLAGELGFARLRHQRLEIRDSYDRRRELWEHCGSSQALPWG